MAMLSSGKSMTSWRIVSGVQRQPGKGWGGPTCLRGQMQHDEHVFAVRDEQHRASERRGNFAEDMNGFGFERIQIRQLIGGTHTIP